MNEQLKRHLISAGITFVSTFLTTLGAALVASGSIEFTIPALVGLLIASARTALKVVLDQFIPVSLGGRKK